MKLMKLDDVREAILQEWLNLPDERRQSEYQAALFATKAMHRYSFGLNRDPFELIMTWLDPYIPLRAGLQPTQAVHASLRAS